MNWDRRSRPDTIMRDSSAAICHRYEREGKEGRRGGGRPGEIEGRERESGGGRETFCSETLPQKKKKKSPTITQAPGPRLRLACEDGNNYFYTRQESVQRGKGASCFRSDSGIFKDILCGGHHNHTPVGGAAAADGPIAHRQHLLVLENRRGLLT